MSHQRATSKQKIFKQARYGSTRVADSHDGGHWLPKSGGAMRSKKDKQSDRSAIKRELRKLTGYDIDI